MKIVEWLYYLVRADIWVASAFWLFMGVCSMLCTLNGWEDIHNYDLKMRHRVQGVLSFGAGIYAMIVSLIFSVLVK